VLSLVGILSSIFARRVEKGESYVHTKVLVDSGIYSVVRHPQYLSFFFLIVALILVAQDWLNTLIGLIAVFLFYIDTSQADQSLIEKFGNNYRHYMKRVPRLNFFIGIIRRLQDKK